MLNNIDGLKDRVEARRHQLSARLLELKTDTRHEAIAATKSINRSLSELDDALVDGWDKISEAVRGKLTELLARTIK